MKKFAIIAATLFFPLFAYGASQMRIVAAENFYGDVAYQLGKPYVQVTSLLNKPNQDPHLFNVSPQTGVVIEKADILIANGAGYDPWMDRLYHSSSKKSLFIKVSHLLETLTADDSRVAARDKPSAERERSSSQQSRGSICEEGNPHIWYAPNTMPTFAHFLTQKLIERDPSHARNYQNNLAAFLKNAQQYQTRLKKIRKQVAGMSVTATEPILGCLTDALDLTMMNKTFQQDKMNEVDLTPVEIINFENSLKAKKVKLLIYNIQVTDSITANLKALAIKNHIPVFGVSEVMPVHSHYYIWMNETLTGIEQALIHSSAKSGP